MRKRDYVILFVAAAVAYFVMYIIGLFVHLLIFGN